jgi:hypothetical protein
VLVRVASYCRQVRTLVEPSTVVWAPELNVDWKVGNRHTWAITADPGHPAIGLGFAGLTAALREAELLPADWGEHLAAQYALAAHAFLSFEVGSRGGLRGAWSARMRSLAGVLMTQRAGLAVPFPRFAELYTEFRGDTRWGWGDGSGGMRRLYERCIAVPDLLPVDPARRRRLQPESPNDYSALDKAWQIERSSGGHAGSYLPLLPYDVVGCFAPSRREVMVRVPAGSPDEEDQQQRLAVPSLWELLAVAFVLGPAEVFSRAERFVDQESMRQARPRRDHNTEDPLMSPRTLEALRGNLNGSLKAMRKIATRIPELSGQWEFVSMLGPLDRETRRRGRTTTRTAVPLSIFRRARQRHVALLESSRKTSRDGGSTYAVKEKKRYTTVLRRLLWLDLYAQTAARPTELAPTLRVKHFDPSHRFDLGDEMVIRPAILYESSKAVPIAPHWRTIHEHTAALIAEWIEWMELGPSDWLFPRESRRTPWAANEVGRAFTNQQVIPLFGAEHGYQISRLRHMGESLGYNVGALWLDANPSYMDRVSTQVFADAFLGHVMSTDRLGYKDLEERREIFAFHAAVGDPRKGVPGVLDFLIGDVGARKGWDLAEIRARLRALDAATGRAQRAEAALGAAQRAVQRTQRQLDAAFGRRDGPANLAAGRAVPSERSWDQLLEVEHHHRRARDEREDATREVEHAQREVEKAHAALDHLRTAGPCLPLDDREPSQHEITDGGVALDLESWEQALERAEVLRGTASAALSLHATGSTVVTRVRAHLNLQELAGVCNTSDRTVRNWCRSGPLKQGGISAAPFPTEGPNNPLVTVTSRLRCIAVERLPRAFMDRLSPSQLELIEQILMVDMGSTRWGGPSIDPARIAAVERLAHSFG